MVDWTKKSIVPRGNLEAWYQFVVGESGTGVAPDYSGKGRNASAASNGPVAWANAINGEYAWYSDGTKNPLTWSGAITVKHVFMVAAFEEASFIKYRGLLTSISTPDLFVSDASGTKFFHFGYAPNSYYKAGVSHAAGDLQAPVNSQFAIIEAKVDSGSSSWNGIMLGKQSIYANTEFKGWFTDPLIYSVDQDDSARKRIYEYYAMRYQLWEKNAAGLYVFPFASNKTRALEADKENYLSEPYSGDLKALVRGNFKDRLQLSFLLREQEEFDAAKAFFKQHYPLGKFVFRDYRYYPYRETTVRFTSPIREQGSDVSYRFNYSFEVIEA